MIFLENGSQLGVFWPSEDFKFTTELSEKVQYSRNQAIKNDLNETILLTFKTKLCAFQVTKI